MKPYYRRGNKWFYKKGKKRMTVERTDAGVYNFNGDFIEGEINIPPINEDNLQLKAKIKIYK